MTINRIRWSGLLALLGGMLGILLTLPFAAAYFRAYPGFEAPPRWLPSVELMLDVALHRLAFSMAYVSVPSNPTLAGATVVGARTLGAGWDIL